MATISKESLADFWLNSFPISSSYECISFLDSTIVQNLLDFIPNNNSETKVFSVINDSLSNIKSKANLPKKNRRINKTTLMDVDSKHLRFSIQIDAIQHINNDPLDIKEIKNEPNIEDRTIENLLSILNETDLNTISQRFHRLIYPWLIDVSFTISNDIFSIIIELMNRHIEEFFHQCFIPWLRNTSNENMNLFLSNLFTQLTNLSDRYQLCLYICQNSTCPFNDNELSILGKWFDSKEFYFSDDLFNVLLEKIFVSSKVYSDNLIFSKLLHKILIKSTEYNYQLTNEQRSMVKQTITINTTILSDILMDLLND